MRVQKNLGFLPIGITVLALLDGVLPLSLRFALFSGPRPGGPPPGAAPGGPGPGSRPPGPQLPLPLTELFILNFVGYLVLILVFWLAPRWLGAKSWLIDVGMIVYTSLAIIAWFDI